MTTNVILIAGTTVEHEVVSGETSTWALIPRLTEIGAIGEQSEPKEKTTLQDTIKKYDSGLRDAPDKNLKGQYIPVQAAEDEYYDEYVLQQAFITRVRNEEEFNIRVNWPDNEVNGFLFKSLGFEWDQGSQEDYKMFTTNGKQNSRVVYAASIAGTLTVTTSTDTQLTMGIIPATIDTGEGTVYWKSADVNLATVDANGLVSGVLAGTVAITAEFRGVSVSADVVVS